MKDFFFKEILNNKKNIIKNLFKKMINRFGDKKTKQSNRITIQLNVLYFYILDHSSMRVLI